MRVDCCAGGSGGGGGGANTALSNLILTAVNQSLIPGADAAIGLGTSALRWTEANFSTGVFIWGAAADAQPLMALIGTSLQFGAGGASAVDAAFGRLAANILGFGAGDSLRFQGGTSGDITISPPATPTSYALVLPAAQGAASSLLQNNGSGVLSWATAAAVSPWTTTAGVVNLITATDNVTIGSATNLAKLGVDGDTDEIQLLVQGHSAQTSNLAVFESSAGTDVVVIGPPALPGNSSAVNWLKVVGTMPSAPSVAPYGVFFSITGAGSAAIYQAAVEINYNAGYTGSSPSIGLEVLNFNAGTGTALNIGAAGNNPSGVSGLNAFAFVTTTGTNVGSLGDASGGNVNVGLFGKAAGTKASATNIGVLGNAINAGATPVVVGGYFGIHSATPTFASAALMCDNGAVAVDIFVARDNGTAVFTIIDAGAVEMIEITAPAAPAANKVRFYCADNGSGKTALYALFPSGAAQLVAIEP